MRILIICLSLLIAPPAFAQNEGSTISATSSTGQDAAIAIRIRDILDALGHSDDITVMVDDGVVTLHGTANSAPEISQTTGVAGHFEGVVAVRNEVTKTNEIGHRLDPPLNGSGLVLNSL